jgi:hypothetical protein
MVDGQNVSEKFAAPVFMVEDEGSAEMSVPIYQARWHHIPQD